MDVSLRPIGGLRETASAQPLVPALRRMVFLQSFTSEERGEKTGKTGIIFRKSTNQALIQSPGERRTKSDIL